MSETSGLANVSDPNESEDAESNKSEDSCNSLAKGTGQWRSPDDSRRNALHVKRKQIVGVLCLPIQCL